ncbi:MAG: carboxypeptidase regulatory-like domain-containing protein [Polyangia bacterium]|jgi:hypothetical protein|nr:carboxypeptidase regulatory-like domain-containing protein [Polyangia bacterium]
MTRLTLRPLGFVTAFAASLLALGLGAEAALAAPPAMTREQIIDRAVYGVGYSYWWGHGCWRTDGQSLGSCSGSCPSCTHTGSYGADCSGYVAKAWQVPSEIALTTDSHPYSTYNFRWESTWWSQVGWGDAKKADAFVYRNSANTGGHIILYESGDPWGSIWAYEAKGCSYGIVHNLKQLGSTYVALRRDNLTEAPVNGNLLGVIFEDLGVGVADMSVRLPGAQVECAGQGTTTAGSPDGDWSFSLPPGSYTVTASAAGYLPGSRTCQVLSGQDNWCSIGLFAECAPDCSGRECGLDPVCGQPCGTCAQGEVCTPAGSCEQLTGCALDCTGRDCGPDPVCGETCGVCPPQLWCNAAGNCEAMTIEDAKIYGYVVAAPEGATGDLSGYPVVPGALVSLDGVPMRESDHFGYWELIVAPGAYQLRAEASGYDPGETQCSVVAQGFTECIIPVYTSGTEPPDPDPPDPPDQGPGALRSGCACGAGSAGGALGGLLLIGMLCWLFVRARARERRSI